MVEVKAEMEDNWEMPSEDEINFRDGKVIFTPNKGGESGFARVETPIS